MHNTDALNGNPIICGDALNGNPIIIHGYVLFFLIILEGPIGSNLENSQRRAH